MCSDSDQLMWLVDMANNRMKAWGGIARLREILCSRFVPSDGITVELSGEELYHARIESEDKQKLEEWRREAKLLPMPEQEANARLLAEIESSGVLSIAKEKPKRPSPEEIREAERQIAEAKPTLSEAEKARRIHSVEFALMNKSRVEKVLEGI